VNCPVAEKDHIQKFSAGSSAQFIPPSTLSQRMVIIYEDSGPQESMMSFMGQLEPG